MRDDAKSLLDTLERLGPSYMARRQAHISRDSRTKGLILEGAVTTDEEMIEVFRQRNALGGLASVHVDDAIEFDNTSSIRSLNKPILVIHGDNDPNIPTRMGEQLHAASAHTGSQLYIVEDGRHADTFHIDEQNFKTRITDFINGLNVLEGNDQ